MSEFKKYKRTNVAEMRPVSDAELEYFEEHGHLPPLENDIGVSISDADLQNGSPKSGDMIARNPKNHSDQWLVAEKYFEDNFEELE